MLQSRKESYRGPVRHVLGLLSIALAACFIWWLLNMAFPDRMQTLMQALRDLL